MQHRVFLVLFLALISALAPVSGAAGTINAFCQTNTGLDPACPLTSVGVGVSTNTLNGAATLRTDTFFASLALHGNQEIAVSLPLYQHLGISGVGDAFGTGNLSLGYTNAFETHKRLTQVAGFSALLNSGGAAFASTGRSQLAPLYALSYALGNRISLVAIGQYAFDAGGTKMPFSPRTQTLNIVSRAIVDLSKAGLYTAVDLNGSNVTGDERYQAYQADATLGIVRGRTDLAFNYSVPIARFTREHVFYRTIGAQFSWRR